MTAGAIPIELTVIPHDGWYYRGVWSDGRVQLENIPEAFLDLMPFMLARVLLEQGYNAARPFIVRLQGADYELMRATLGAAAATPLVNAAKPVANPLRCVFNNRSRRAAR